MLNEVMYKVPLNKLYKIIASCSDNYDIFYCPVIVQIID